MTPPPRVVITGASGFIGQRMVEEFSERGFEVRCVGRHGPDASWNDQGAITRLIDGAAVVINLAGKSVNCRYTRRNRDEILRSRLSTTATLGAAIEQAEHPPAIWLNASTSTIYRYSMDRPMNEDRGELGAGFSVDVARNWEHEFFAAPLPHTRRVALRMSIVLGDGPATSMLLRLARLGLGGPQHDGWWFGHRRYRGIGPAPTAEAAHSRRSRGKQRFSWIHIDDVVGAIDHLIEHEEISGPVNLASPGVSNNAELMATMRRVVHRRIGLPAFRWMLEPAMWLLRTEPELVLKSRWVEPEVLRASGYQFVWPELEPALRSVVSQGT
ncbi:MULTISPECIES: epimerase [unclassified Leucobacter]|uniref:epimerase n=1 Tax=unclassified Leucobacter TaxID=2621730 RepID=UPI00165E7F57|nr:MULTISPECIES: DUF1731 domain-containing protein [unclassified Leucobacter]MBC9927836.1 DUF1731 domain-containing protein [Leucobacter sp. cx-169]